jgi:hypothetical protein
MIALTSRPEPKPSELNKPVPEMFAAVAPEEVLVLVPDDELLEPVIALEIADDVFPTLEMLLMSEPLQVDRYAIKLPAKPSPR